MSNPSQEHHRAYWFEPDTQPDTERFRFDSLVETTARTSPDRDVLVFCNDSDDVPQRISYAALAEEIGVTAAALRASGVGRGDAVAIYGPNLPETVSVQFACARLGAAMVPVGIHATADDLAYMVRTSGARLLIYLDRFRDLDLGANVRRILADCSDQITPICIGEAAGGLTLKDWIARAEGTRVTFDEGPGMPDDTALILFSSGTTGKPKAIPHSNATLVRRGKLTAERAGLEEACRYAHAMPFFHVGGSVTAMSTIYSVGGTQLCLPTYSPEKLAQLIALERATAVLAVPTMMISLAGKAREHGHDFSSLRTVLTGGAIVPETVARTWIDTWKVGLSNTYGMTEMGGPIIQTAPSDPLSRSLISVGRPHPGVEVEVVSTATGDRVQMGEEGELRYRSRWIMEGYLKDGDIDRSVFTEDEWLPSGDLGVMEPDGFVRITGRVKDLIIRGGENIAPAEVEDAIRKTCPEIADVSVAGVPDDYYGEAIAAFICLLPGEALSSAAIRERLNCQISRYKIPSHWIKLERLPTTPSGKVQRFKLVEMFKEEDVNQLT